MDRPVVAVVLAGGVGTRLYPAARSDRPKQFLPLAGERSLLARTLDRTGFADATVIATRPAFADEVRERAPTATVLTEPEPKDTGPAMLYATHRARSLLAAGELPIPATDEEPVVVVLPADHHVPDAEAFESAMARGAAVAGDTGRLVTFGVEPTRPETGYGYIELGDDHGDYHDLAEFHEKPDAETAREYRDAGHRWNAGIFAWTPAALAQAARDSPLAPMLDPLDAGEVESAFEAVEPESIDYAVMERADDAAVVPVSFAWDDLGSWDALERVVESDADGNARLVDGVTVDSSGNVVAGDDGKHVSLVGVEDLCVVAYDDRVLVVPKAESQRVREVVSELREADDF
jgi:mannose-1-phosphate guanylyltransferase